MKKSKLIQKTVNKLVDASFKDGRMLEIQVFRSIKVLKSLPSAEAIQALSEYLKALKRKEREHTMCIETVIPLSPTQISKAKKIVERKYLITKVLVSINPDILGGFKLRIGDQIWDESVLGKINQVKEAITR
ncbi:F0F1 ATP synthase subunit delta [Candidatus Daviesbacteria bacterium]|nr:F0F1 ATP synthase subunit delta [Candidatus Daviesbacteria bacterium]